MKGLILNNLYTVEKSIKSSIFIAIVTVTTLILSKNPSAFKIAIFLPFLLIPVHAFEVLKHDAKSGWDKFQITLPVVRYKIIQSKYLTFILLFLVSLLITLILFYIVEMFIYPTFTNEFFNQLLRGMGIILCIAAVVYPATYKLGTEKSDSIMISSMGFAFGMFFLISLLLEMIIGTNEGYDEIFSVTFLLVSIFLFVISYFISSIIYKQKEF